MFLWLSRCIICRWLCLFFFGYHHLAGGDLGYTALGYGYGKVWGNLYRGGFSPAETKKLFCRVESRGSLFPLTRNWQPFSRAVFLWLKTTIVFNTPEFSRGKFSGLFQILKKVGENESFLFVGSIYF